MSEEIQKRVVVLGGGVIHHQIYQQLHESGFYSICIDRAPTDRCRRFANETHAIDIRDINSLSKIVRKYDAIIALNEIGVQTEQLLGYDRVPQNMCYKDVIRDMFQEHKIRQPEYWVYHNIRDAVSEKNQFKYPIIVKPIFSSGGRGVAVINSASDFESAIAGVAPFVGVYGCIIEEYIPGIECTVETFTYNGKTIILTTSDKTKTDNPIVAKSLRYPALEKYRDKIEPVAIRMVEAAGVKTGISHAEIMISKDGIYPIELGCRPGGGHIFHTIIKKTCGVDAVESLAKAMFNEKVETTPNKQSCVEYRFFTPSYGRLIKYSNMEEASMIDGVLDVGMFKQTGEIVGDNRDSTFRTGYIVTTGGKRKEASECADIVECIVDFEIEPI